MSKVSAVYKKILKVSGETGLPVKKILDTLFVLRDGKPVGNNKLVGEVGVSKNLLNKVKSKLSRLLEPASKNTQLKKNYIRKVERVFNDNYKSEEVVWEILKDKKYKEVLEQLSSYQSESPRPKREYDQFGATSETTALRASLLNHFGDIKGKRILFLGDDDLTSAAVTEYQSAEKPVVLDIDKRILNQIKSISEERDLEIEAIHYDARNNLPRRFSASFDVIFTDPPYTPQGFKLFVSRAISLLDKKNKAARIYVCYGASDGAKERYMPIHKVLTDSGLMIRWVFDKFNRYHGAESVGNASSLFVCDITPKTTPIIRGKYEQEIYTHN